MSDFQVVEMDLVLELIRARISAATRVPLPVFELTQVFHYGQEVFEWLKAYRQPDGGVAMFRPDRNAARMVRSCEPLRFLRTETAWHTAPFDSKYLSMSTVSAR